jgi:hypothetical protein
VPVTATTDRKRFTRWDNKAIDAIRLVPITEFELSDKELRQLRTHLYKVNRDGIRRYRTLREDRVVLVWRIK